VGGAACGTGTVAAPATLAFFGIGGLVVLAGRLRRAGR